jgi:sugar lactone lactonase YvrE
MNAALQLGNDGSTAQMIEPTGVSLNGDSSLFVSDQANTRVLEYKAPIKGNQLATVVLGAYTLNNPGKGVFANPSGSAVDSKGNLWVADGAYNRVLEFVPALWNGKPAALAIGQPDLTTTAANLSQNGLFNPNAVAFDGHGNLWVSDSGNVRVLEFVPPFSTGMNASVVIGQADFTSNSRGVSASQILGPDGITFVP